MWPLINNDWIILIVLGASVAVLSFAVDVAVSALNKARLHLYTTAAETNIFAGIASWVLPIVGMEYLTLKTLISKLIGLTVVLPSGLPIGKEGPFVHIGGIVATLWCKLFALISHDDKNQNYYVEMVAAGCAVGVTCTFGSPIGGVLFSIEVTSVHFALRNYWRGFFSAVFSAISDGVFIEITICTPRIACLRHFRNSMRIIWGPFCNMAQTSVRFHHSEKVYENNERKMITSKNILDELFSNFTWSEAPENSYQLNVISQWSHENFSIYFALLFFILYTFIMSGICITLPVACGMFTPVLLIGAALGRLFGELLVIYFPNVSSLKIVPGSYALVPQLLVEQQRKQYQRLLLCLS
ncbi:Chloride channel protein 1 [Trichinella pseudospiralis]|uniref:Chloride channel protein 1 n=1 Tax=Trichinella pseudospiralis TaxID=6337 RepID=A0A0V0XGF0_TRIPS|nr:Chloride channel protein 1 [Trichinella pseudospiralis]